jgi:hypothetical protein
MEGRGDPRIPYRGRYRGEHESSKGQEYAEDQVGPIHSLILSFIFHLRLLSHPVPAHLIIRIEVARVRTMR